MKISSLLWNVIKTLCADEQNNTDDNIPVLHIGKKDNILKQSL